MWDVIGRIVNVDRFAPFSPVDVIDYYDGPRIFTFTSSQQEEYLAFWCDETTDIQRYIVVAASAAIVKRLRTGRISVRDAMDQPWLWVLNTKNNGELLQAWSTNLSDVPGDVLPVPGTMLSPDLEPLLTSRAIGSRIGEGTTPGSVIRDVIDGAEKALKVLIEHILETTSTVGRSLGSVRKLYDLPTVNFAFNSFEVSFGSPLAEEPLLTGTVNESESNIYAQVRVLLKKGLDSLDAGFVKPETIGNSSAESLIILKAMERLTPPSSGYIESIELRGSLVDKDSAPGSPVRLNRSARSSVRRAIQQLTDQGHQERELYFLGVIQAINKAQNTFDIRVDADFDSRENIAKPLTLGGNFTLAYEPPFEDEVFDACLNEKQVVIVAYRDVPNSMFFVIHIREKSLEDTQTPEF